MEHSARGASSQQQQKQMPPGNLPSWMLILQGQSKRIRIFILKTSPFIRTKAFLLLWKDLELENGNKNPDQQ